MRLPPTSAGGQRFAVRSPQSTGRLPVDFPLVWQQIGMDLSCSPAMSVFSKKYFGSVDLRISTPSSGPVASDMRCSRLHAGSGSVAFETRSGNVSRAQKDWSPWAKLSTDRVASPAARFLQYRATVSGAAELYDVTTAYEMKNVAPVIDALESTPANYKFPAPVPAAPNSRNAAINP